MYIFFGILFVCILFILAMIFPKYYCRIYDSRTLNQVTATDVQLQTYEASYDSFQEKLHAIARAYHKNGILRAVPMSDLEIGPDQSELTNIANKELKTMKEHHILEKKLKSSKRYTIYSEADLRGISCWVLVYATTKKEITIYLDEEFHNIFFLKIKNTSLSFDKDGLYSSSITQSDNIHQKIGQKLFYTWWEGMIEYYNLDINNLNFVTDNIEANGKIEFEDASQIMLYEQWSYDEYGNVFWCMGIPIEKMIQF